MSGQEIAIELEKRRGERPSPGTIYPALKSLLKNKWLIEERRGKSIFYNLTKEGKEILKESKNQFCKTFMDIF